MYVVCMYVTFIPLAVIHVINFHMYDSQWNECHGSMSVLRPLPINLALTLRHAHH